MNQLRLEADEAVGKVEELQSKVKTLEQENLSKEQEITSLQHKNNLLETEVEKLETAIKDFKKAADEGQQHGTQNETLQRRLQLLEEEAENADKDAARRQRKVRSALARHRNALFPSATCITLANTMGFLGSVRPMSRPATSNARCRPSRTSVISGSKSTRRWPRSIPVSRKS